MNDPRIQFRDYLPEVFRGGDAKGANFLAVFLRAFEAQFEDLQARIEGKPIQQNPEVLAGGIPDLFDPQKSPPPEFELNPDAQFDFLRYLASWIALPLRVSLIRKDGEGDADYVTRRLDFNRKFFAQAIPLQQQRSTREGIEAMLRAWLAGEIAEQALVVTDLTRPHTDTDAVFQLGESASIGVNAVLGEGPPYFFLVDIVIDPGRPELRHPYGIDVLQRSVQFLLDAEKPAHTGYQLRLRAPSMQLAEEGHQTIDGLPAAQLGVTSLLAGEPWTFNSE